jgi:toxin FitB
MYLIDTNVISEAFRGSPEAAAWLALPDSKPLHLSVITLGEIERGIVLAQRHDLARAAKLAKWLKGLQAAYQDRILPVDEAISLIWGKLSSKKERGDADGLIAATALIHGMTLVTRNVRDFADTGVQLVNPWAAS